LHLLLGVFTAPAIFFFAFTGALQTFSLHESSRDGTYRPDRWIVVLAQIHKKQTAQVPVPKTAPDSAGASGKSAKGGQELRLASAARPAHNPLPLRIFFLIVAISLFASTLSGLYMGWHYKRNKLVLCLLFAAGILAPVLMIVL
jgi:hypothetical protein